MMVLPVLLACSKEPPSGASPAVSASVPAETTATPPSTGTAEGLVRGPAVGAPAVTTPQDTGEGFWMENFSWVLPDQLAGMAQPGLYAPLEDDLAFLVDQGIDLLVSLTVEPTDPDTVAAYGIDLLHIPVEDMTAPTQDQLDDYVAEARPRIAGGEQVGVHCTAGLGRTGTFLAVYLVTEGRTGQEAIDEVRKLRPGSIETEEQEQAVVTFYERWTAGEVPL